MRAVDTKLCDALESDWYYEPGGDDTSAHFKLDKLLANDAWMCPFFKQNLVNLAEAYVRKYKSVYQYKGREWSFSEAAEFMRHSSSAGIPHSVTKGIALLTSWDELSWDASCILMQRAELCIDPVVGALVDKNEVLPVDKKPIYTAGEENQGKTRGVIVAPFNTCLAFEMVAGDVLQYTNERFLAHPVKVGSGPMDLEAIFSAQCDYGQHRAWDISGMEHNLAADWYIFPAYVRAHQTRRSFEWWQWFYRLSTTHLPVCCSCGNVFAKCQGNCSGFGDTIGSNSLITWAYMVLLIYAVLRNVRPESELILEPKDWVEFIRDFEIAVVGDDSLQSDDFAPQLGSAMFTVMRDYSSLQLKLEYDESVIWGAPFLSMTVRGPGRLAEHLKPHKVLASVYHHAHSTAELPGVLNSALYNLYGVPSRLPGGKTCVEYVRAVAQEYEKQTGCFLGLLTDDQLRRMNANGTGRPTTNEAGLKPVAEATFEKQSAMPIKKKGSKPKKAAPKGKPKAYKKTPLKKESGKGYSKKLAIPSGGAPLALVAKAEKNGLIWAAGLKHPDVMGVGQRVPDASCLIPTSVLCMTKRFNLNVYPCTTPATTSEAALIVCCDPINCYSSMNAAQATPNTWQAQTGFSIYGADIPGNYATLQANAYLYRTVNAMVRVYSTAPVLKRGGTVWMSNLFDLTYGGVTGTSRVTASAVSAALQTQVFDLADLGGRGASMCWLPATSRGSSVFSGTTNAVTCPGLGWRNPASAAAAAIGIADSVMVIYCNVSDNVNTSIQLGVEITYNVEFIPNNSSQATFPGLVPDGSTGAVSAAITEVMKNPAKPIDSIVQSPQTAADQAGLPSSGEAKSRGGPLDMVAKLGMGAAKAALSQTGVVGKVMTNFLDDLDCKKHEIACYMDRCYLSPVTHDQEQTFAHSDVVSPLAHLTWEPRETVDAFTKRILRFPSLTELRAALKRNGTQLLQYADVQVRHLGHSNVNLWIKVAHALNMVASSDESAGGGEDSKTFAPPAHDDGTSIASDAIDGVFYDDGSVLVPSGRTVDKQLLKQAVQRQTLQRLAQQKTSAPQ